MARMAALWALAGGGDAKGKQGASSKEGGKESSGKESQKEGGGGKEGEGKGDKPKANKTEQRAHTRAGVMALASGLHSGAIPEWLPAIFFSFSKRECEDYARAVSRKDRGGLGLCFTSAEEQEAVDLVGARAQGGGAGARRARHSRAPRDTARGGARRAITRTCWTPVHRPPGV